jgi:hypothetical protein
VKHFKGVCPVTPVVHSKMNGYSHFAIMPDGSKEGWADSDNGDEKRQDFKDMLLQENRIGNYCEFVEVRYGRDDGGVAEAVDSNTRR